MQKSVNSWSANTACSFFKVFSVLCLKRPLFYRNLSYHSRDHCKKKFKVLWKSPCVLYINKPYHPHSILPPPPLWAEMRKIVEVTTNPMRLLSWEIVTWLLGNVVLCITFMFPCNTNGYCNPSHGVLLIKKYQPSKGGFSKLKYTYFFFFFARVQQFPCFYPKDHTYSLLLPPHPPPLRTLHPAVKCLSFGAS